MSCGSKSFFSFSPFWAIRAEFLRDYAVKNGDGYLSYKELMRIILQSTSSSGHLESPLQCSVNMFTISHTILEFFRYLQRTGLISIVEHSAGQANVLDCLRLIVRAVQGCERRIILGNYSRKPFALFSEFFSPILHPVHV